jgi:hypothetical protein
MDRSRSQGKGGSQMSRPPVSRKPYRVTTPDMRKVLKSFAHPDEAIDYLESHCGPGIARYFWNSDTDDTFDIEGRLIV